MIILRALLSVLVAATLASAQDLTPCSSTGELLQGTNVLRALLSRQVCTNPGFSQCPGYSACCPAGGNCCIRSSDNHLLGCCPPGEECATTSTGLFGCCTPGVNCARISRSSADISSIPSHLLALPAAVGGLVALLCKFYVGPSYLQ